MKYLIILFFVSFLSACDSGTESLHGKIGTTRELRKQIQQSQENSSTDFPEPRADINELERELNNGGFSQYFFNSSGQNCFKTLGALEARKDEYHVQLATLLSKAIEVINNENLTSEELIRKIRARELVSLENDSVNNILDSLDNVYYGN